MTLLSACGGSAEPRPSGLVTSSDPVLAAAAEELVPDLAARAGLELSAPVRLERRSREQLVGYLTAKLDEELPPELADQMVRSYALLGLVPPDLDLRALLLAVYTEQVAGFYDPDSTALFVLDDQAAESLESVLIHELVHAIQDQAADLDSLTDPVRGNDRQTAAQAAIEGHATLVMMEYLMERMQGSPVDLSTLDGFGAELRAALGTVRSQFPALGSAPRVIQESLLFPYIEGAGLVQSLWSSVEERVAPFGDHLPASTEQVLHPEKLLEAPRDPPREVELDLGGARIVHEDVLGALESRIMLEELSGSPAPSGPLGWLGDRYALVEAEEGDALVWVVAFDDPQARDAFAAGLRPHIGGLPLPATLEDSDLSGAPALTLRVGDPGAVVASLTPEAGSP